MAASDKTVNQILNILIRHLSQEQIVAIIDDLYYEVQDNTSVRATISALRDVIKQRGR